MLDGWWNELEESLRFRCVCFSFYWPNSDVVIIHVRNMDLPIKYVLCCALFISRSILHSVHRVNPSGGCLFLYKRCCIHTFTPANRIEWIVSQYFCFDCCSISLFFSFYHRPLSVCSAPKSLFDFLFRSVFHMVLLLLAGFVNEFVLLLLLLLVVISVIGQCHKKTAFDFLSEFEWKMLLLSLSVSARRRE